MNQINGQTFLLALTAISDGGRLHDSVERADRHRRVQSSGRSNGPAIAESTYPSITELTFARLH